MGNKVADTDRQLIANYEKIDEPTINKDLPVPKNIDVIGGYMKADVEWDNVDIDEVDYILIHLEDIDMTDVVTETSRSSINQKPLVPGVDYRETIVVASTRKNTVIEEINALKRDFVVILQSYNSVTNEISEPSEESIFTTLVKPARGEAATCSVFGEMDTASLYNEDDFVLDFEWKNDITPKGYAFEDDVKLTLHIETLIKADLIVNLLDFPTFGWHGGMTKRPEAGVFDEKISFPVEDDVENKKLLVSAILVPPGKDYTENLISTNSEYIKGLKYVAPAPQKKTTSAAAATAANDDDDDDDDDDNDDDDIVNDDGDDVLKSNSASAAKDENNRRLR